MQPSFPSSTPAVSPPPLALDPLLLEYCRQQGRGLRLFDARGETIWDGEPNRARRFPIYRDAERRVISTPEDLTGRRAWPVARALATGQPADRSYWIENEAGEKQCFRVRAWVLRDDPEHGRIVIEETEATDKRFCPEARIQQLDSELATLIEQVAAFLANRDAPQSLRLRLTNPHLQHCHELKTCSRPECPAHVEEAGLRCWELSNTRCRDGMQLQNALEKFHYCDQCEVFLLACPDPLTRVGENFNRLLSLLQIKHYEALEAQERIQQAEKLATIGELMASLAHEIKTPLSVIMGRLQCLELEQGSLAPEELAEDLRVMHGHAERVCAILDEVLSMARPKAPEMRPLQLNEEVRHIVSMLRKTLEKGGIEVRLQLAARLPRVKADPRQIQQVLINLMLNARDAMTGGGVLAIRTWRARGESPAVALSVADSGQGIDPEQLPRVFSPFFSTKLERGGTGLGLAVCQRILIDHGGRIEVASRPGRGATFTARLPILAEETA